MQTWIPIIVLAITVINTWLLKWVDLNKIPDTEKTKSKSSVYIKKYKTGIVMLALLASASTLAYLMFSSFPMSKVAVLLISLNVCAIFMAVLAWVFMVNNERLKKRIEDAETLAWILS